MKDGNHQENKEYRMQRKNKDTVWWEPSREDVIRKLIQQVLGDLSFQVPLRWRTAADELAFVIDDI